MIRYVLSKLSFYDLVKLGPVCKEIESLKRDLLKNIPLEQLKLALSFHKLSKIEIKESSQCVGCLIPDVLEKCQIPWRKQSINVTQFPKEITQENFQELQSPVFRVKDQTRKIYFTLFSSDCVTEESKILTIYPSTKDRWMVYPLRTFGKNNWICDQKIVWQLSQIFLNRHPRYKLRVFQTDHKLL